MKRGFFFLFPFYSILSFATGCYAHPTAQLTLRVIDSEGQPVPNVKMSASFWMGEDNQLRETGKDGLVTFTSSVREEVVISNELEHVGFDENLNKYYWTVFRNWYSRPQENVKDGKWQPWDPCFDFLLQERRDPIPMYATGSQHTEILPTRNEWFGFDMQACDWVAPHGKGTHADIEVMHEWNDASSETSVSQLHFRFPDQLAGCYWFDCVDAKLPTTKVQLRSPYHVEKNNAYATKALSFAKKKRARAEGSKKRKDLFDDRGIAFRTRTRVDAEGRLLGAQYGKMYAPAVYQFRLLEEGKTEVVLHYYLNPTENDTNVEFDFKKNLIKGLFEVIYP